MAGLTRTDIWKWYTASKPKKSRSKVKNADRPVSDGNLIKIAAAVDTDGDKLLVGMWKGHDSVPCGVYYMTPSGEHYWSADGDAWQRGKIEYAPYGGYDVWCWPRNCYRWIGNAATVIGHWTKEHFSDQPWYYENTTNPIDVLDEIERNLSRIKRVRTNKRRQDRISEWVSTLPPLPDGLGEWTSRVVFADIHYAIQTAKGSGVYTCTACTREVEGSEWRNNQWYTCPSCGAKVQARKSWDADSFRTSSDRVSVYLDAADMDGRPCVAMLTLYAEKKWSRSGERVSFDPARAAVLPRRRKACEHGLIYYYHGSGVWDTVNTWGFKCSDHYLYPFEPSLLDGTYYERISRNIAGASLRGWRLNWDNFMYHDCKAAAMEYLIKGGFERLVCESARNMWHPCELKWQGESMEEIFLLDRQSIARLKAANGGHAYLQWLRVARGCIPALTIREEVLRWLVANRIEQTDIAFALELPGMTLEKAVNYIKRQLAEDPKLGGGVRYSNASRAESAARVWRDYLGLCKSMGVDTTMEYNYKPRALRARHDELSELLAIRRKREQMEAEAAEWQKKVRKMEAKYPLVSSVCERIKTLYEFSDESYSVTVPTCAWDVMQEGVLLGHCTSRDEDNVYLERMEKEVSYIMFLRKTDKPDQPWYTMEVEPGGNVIQLRTYGDKEGEDRAEAKAFLGKWRREVARRCGQGEISKAQKSREELLKYWDGLTKGGNIIRRGHLAGKLLVDVLKSDYKELNGELPKEAIG